jgi:alpha-1,2-mannosyltransferase
VFTVAHDSGGPKLDIVVNDDEGRTTGFRASTAEQYCDKLEEALKSSDANTVTVEAARRHVAKKFSNEVFEERFLAATNSLLP